VNDDERRQIVCGVLSQIAPEADLQALEADVELHEQLDIDSMDFLNFMIGLNDATGVDIPERDYPQLASLDGCVEYLRIHAAPR
jgi:acyl carrier protein